MNEAGFSTNFHVYNGEGLPMQFTIRGQDFREFQANLTAFFQRYPQLGGSEMLLREQPDNAIRSMTFRIVGWLRGDTEDKYNPDKLNPCVYLYGALPHLEYSVATVYTEKLGLLPAEVDWREARSIGNQAPMVEKARPKWNSCDFEIVLVPQFDVTGAVVKNKNGKPRYKFSHVVGFEAPDDAQPVQPVAVSSDHEVDFGGSRQGTANSTKNLQEKSLSNELEALSAYAYAFHNETVNPSKALMNLCRRLQEMDKSSARKMSVARMENGQRKAGQYEFVAGLIDNIAGESMHMQVLSLLLGRPVTNDPAHLPSDGLRSFIEEIWPGNKTKSNDKFNSETQSLVKEAISICRVIEDFGIE